MVRSEKLLRTLRRLASTWGGWVAVRTGEGEGLSRFPPESPGAGSHLGEGRYNEVLRVPAIKDGGRSGTHGSVGEGRDRLLTLLGARGDPDRKGAAGAAGPKVGPWRRAGT